MRWWFKTCPRCHGTRYLDHLGDEVFMVCLECGYRPDVDDVRPAKDEAEPVSRTAPQPAIV